VEVPSLSISSISCLENNVSIVDNIKISITVHLGNNIEISFNIKTEVRVKLTLSWLIWILINIDDLPSLVGLAIISVDNDVSVFSINSPLNI
jgi:Zn-dependent M16 (insulinase) family peptidase